jgi:5-hydroxyisourate hydrolase
LRISGFARDGSGDGAAVAIHRRRAEAGRLDHGFLDEPPHHPRPRHHARLKRGAETVASAITNLDGRCEAPLMNGGLARGEYRLEFDVGDYFREMGVPLPSPAFLETVVIDFGVAEPEGHYHVPLLVSPYGYSTYRGS